MPTLRFKFDVIATLLHFVTTALALSTGSFVGSFSGACLTAMEFVAFMFHIFYLTCFRGESGIPRKIKWAEYGISATLGTIAVLHATSAEYPQWEWVLLFMFIGTAQQLIGLLVDVKYAVGIATLWPAFLAGCFIQLGEYVFVGYVGDNYTNPVYWTYVAFYGLFGIHALVGFSLKVREHGDYVEEVYSLYGFIAKLAVFYAEYFYSIGVGELWISLVASAAFIITLIFTLHLFLRAMVGWSRVTSTVRSLRLRWKP